ncbi:hypothetical protein [Pontibacter sp. G13]|uniref:hypothetical protein n=1 Tax=Pontibacter sp. G13 TaxID=3074898 RepID=UPI00288B6595|nr:hypothetical protein [Pontibacter sp. G13]WNJ19277.1 hypothetical protein RJD25_02195 [Pontibacter sp. G13]
MRCILWLIWILLVCEVHAQEPDKVEFERRVSPKDVPLSARNWIEEVYGDPGKIRWYLEQNERGFSYEAKFKWNHKQHSVEFSEAGDIEDIEILIHWDQIPIRARTRIEDYFKEHYKRHKVRRVQYQLTGAQTELRQVIHDETMTGVTVRFEIEFSGKSPERKSLWEALFDRHGNFIRVRRIRISPTDNLRY